MTLPPSDIMRAVADYEALHHAPIEISQTVHMDHDACGDMRGRLYITRKMNDNGTLADLAYCHNCSSGGASLATLPAVRRAVASPATPAAAPPKLDWPAPDLVPPDEPGFPPEAAAFLAPLLVALRDHHSSPRARLAEWGVGYRRSTGRLLLPIWSSICLRVSREHWHSPPGSEHLRGRQERRLWDTGGPKYLTVEADPNEDMDCRFHGAPPSASRATPLVLCEDWLSAAVVSLAPAAPGGLEVMPLFRYKIAAERLAKLAQARHLVVWLDNDKPEVVDEARHIIGLWRALGGSGAVVTEEHDPKGLPPIAVATVVDAALAKAARGEA